MITGVSSNATLVGFIVFGICGLFYFSMCREYHLTNEDQIFKMEEFNPFPTKQTYFKDQQREEPQKNCTLGIFRKYYQEHHYFPGSGKWSKMRNGNNYMYNLDLCKYYDNILINDNIKQCLQNISHIVTMGDSTGGRYSSALRQILYNSSHMNCRRNRQEMLQDNGFIPDKSYFTYDDTASWTEYFNVRYRYCSGCAAVETLCQLKDHNSTHVVSIEHLPMTAIIDDTMKLSVPRDQKEDIHEYYAFTAQEFLLKYYLKERYPDLLLIFIPFHHAKHLTVQRAKADIVFFKSLVKLYIPSTTKVFYIPTASEFENKRKNKGWLNRTFHGRLATDQINEMNHMMYEVLQADLESESMTYGFLDLLKVSSDQQAWSLDGVHMAPIWYQGVMSMFLETYCNSKFK